MLEVDGGMREYLHSLKSRKYDPLTKVEEQKLLKKYRETHDMAVRNRLVMANMRYTTSLVNKYVGKGLSYMELLSEANDGLMESIDRFDQKYNTKLFTYSKWWILQRMKAALDRRTKEADKNITLNISIKERDEEEEEYIEGTKQVVEKDEVTVDDSEETSRTNRAEYIEMLMSVLNEREVNIIKDYFGIDREKSKTLAEIGADYSMSRERIRQIVEQAMLKIRSQAILSDDEDLD